jgi:hypothetical protein
MTVRIRLAVAFSLSLVACGSPSPGGECVPGMSIVCACTATRMGVQVCQADRTYSACTCDTLDAGPSFDAEVALDADADTTLDAAAPADTSDDTAVDAPDPSDAGVPPPPPTWDGSLPRDGICSPDGWCWSDAPGATNWGNFTQVAGTSPTDVWAIGDDGRHHGVVIHFDGTSWRGVTGLPNTFRVVTARAPDDAWVDGMHWDGARWSAAPFAGSPTITAMWARSPTDAWAVGQAGVVQHWDGVRWTAVTSGAVYDLDTVFGFGPDDVYVGGALTTLRHWNGSAWSDVSAGLPSGNVRQLWGAATNDLWALVDGVALHWTGAAWTNYGGTYGTLIGFSASDVTLLGTPSARWDGTTFHTGVRLFTSAGPCNPTLMVAAVAPTVYYAVSQGHSFPGVYCGLYRGDPASGLMGIPAGSTGIQDLYVAAPRDLFAVAGRALERGDGVTWTTVTTGLPGVSTVRGRGPNDVWATSSADDGTLAHWDGARWTVSTVGVHTRLAPVVFGGTTDAYTVGGLQVFRWDGASWMPLGAPLDGRLGGAVDPPSSPLWAASVTDLWLGAEHGYYRWDGTRWAYSSLGVAVWSIGGRSSTDAYLVLDQTIEHWDGTRTTTAAMLPPGVPPFGLVGAWWSSTGELWAVTLTSQLVHWDGVSATEAEIHTPSNFVGIGGEGAADVWAFDDGVGLLHHAP